MFLGGTQAEQSAFRRLPELESEELAKGLGLAFGLAFGFAFGLAFGPSLGFAFGPSLGFAFGYALGVHLTEVELVGDESELSLLGESASLGVSAESVERFGGLLDDGAVHGKAFELLVGVCGEEFSPEDEVRLVDCGGLGELGQLDEVDFELFGEGRVVVGLLDSEDGVEAGGVELAEIGDQNDDAASEGRVVVASVELGSDLLIIEYLREENRVLREQLGAREQRLSLTHEQRRRLAVRAEPLGRAMLRSVATLVTPETLLRWYRELVARKYDGSRGRRAGRPPTKADLAALVLKMARENPTWGYTRLRGALHNLGHELGRSTIQSILSDAGLEPAPERKKRGSWAAFLKAQWGAVAATDFFSVEVLTWSGIVRYQFFVMDLKTRAVAIAGSRRTCIRLGWCVRRGGCSTRSMAS